jgi:hypothetical protein
MAKTVTRRKRTGAVKSRGTHARKARNKKTALKSTVRRTRKTAAHHAKIHHAKRPVKKWSKHVTQTSDALDLKHDVFKQDRPKAIARSLKRSAEHSHRRKSDPYRSAMSMLVFYINRAGKNLPATRRKKLEAAKGELRKAFGKAA